MQDKYVEGFIQKCAELGVDPEVLAKAAAPSTAMRIIGGLASRVVAPVAKRVGRFTGLKRVADYGTRLDQGREQASLLHRGVFEQTANPTAPSESLLKLKGMYDSMGAAPMVAADGSLRNLGLATTVGTGGLIAGSAALGDKEEPLPNPRTKYAGFWDGVGDVWNGANAGATRVLGGVARAFDPHWDARMRARDAEKQLAYFNKERSFDQREQAAKDQILASGRSAFGQEQFDRTEAAKAQAKMDDQQYEDTASRLRQAARMKSLYQNQGGGAQPVQPQPTRRTNRWASIQPGNLRTSGYTASGNAGSYSTAPTPAPQAPQSSRFAHVAPTKPNPWPQYGPANTAPNPNVIRYPLEPQVTKPPVANNPLPNTASSPAVPPPLSIGNTTNMPAGPIPPPLSVGNTTNMPKSVFEPPKALLPPTVQTNNPAGRR